MYGVGFRVLGLGFRGIHSLTWSMYLYVKTWALKLLYGNRVLRPKYFEIMEP